MTKKIDISSTVLEKGLDIARNFVDKLITPAIEETGLLLKDQVTLWKFKNQVKILNKAKDFCDKNNVPLKTISLKILCPLLEYSALEEDDFLQDKWAVLLSNMVDSRQNIENHVIPYILSQLSKDEFLFLDKVYEDKQIRLKRLNEEFDTSVNERPIIEENLAIKIKECDDRIAELKKMGSNSFSTPVWNLRQEKQKFEIELRSLTYKESSILFKLKQPEIVPDNILKEFELSNLIRLGLIKEVQETYANSQTLEIPNRPDESYLTVDLDIEVESNRNYILTELGELFIEACKNKNSTQ